MTTACDELGLEDLDLLSNDILELCDESQNMVTCLTAVESYGMTTTSLSMMHSWGLFSGTALQNMALESMITPTFSNEDSQAALEALVEKQNDNQAKLSAKVLSLLKSIGTTFLSAVTSIGNKILDLVKKAAQTTEDKLKDFGRTVKAHPYKTILGVIAAIALTAGVMIYTASNLPGAAQSRVAMDAFKSKIKPMIEKISGVFCKTKVDTSANAFRIDVVFPASKVENIPLEKMGWNYRAAKEIGVQVNKAMELVKTGCSSFGEKLYSGLKVVGRATVGNMYKAVDKTYGVALDVTGSHQAAMATTGIAGFAAFITLSRICWAIYRLIKKVIVGGFKLIWSTLKAIF